MAHSRPNFQQYQLSGQRNLEEFMVTATMSGEGTRVKVELAFPSVHKRSYLDLHPFFNHDYWWALLRHCYSMRYRTLNFLSNFIPCFFCHVNDQYCLVPGDVWLFMGSWCIYSNEYWKAYVSKKNKSLLLNYFDN